MKQIFSVVRELAERARITWHAYRHKKINGETFLTRKPKAFKTVTPDGYNPNGDGFSKWASKIGVSGAYVQHK